MRSEGGLGYDGRDGNIQSNVAFYVGADVCTVGRVVHDAAVYVNYLLIPPLNVPFPVAIQAIQHIAVVVRPLVNRVITILG